MSGRVCVVTGASAGIGTATALGLAAGGASLALVGRDAARLEEVAQRCRAAGSPEVRTYRVDFASLAQVRGLAESLLADWPAIHVLVNNAALVLQRRETTEDGFEKIFGVNHLAPYLLTRLLLPRLTESAPARVVTVASDAHTFGALDPDDYMSERGYQPLKVYGRSKLANILFTRELARRLEGTGVSTACLHPGFVATSLGRDNKVAAFVLRLIKPFIKSPEDGAATTLQLATAPEVAPGEYYADGAPHRLKDYARDPVMAQRLWVDSAALVGLPAD